MEQGPLEETMIRRARASRQKIPEHITNAPQILPGSGFYFNAFLALSSCRPLGMQEGRIPWLAAYQYSQSLGLPIDEFEELWIVVSYIDAAYLKVRAQQSENSRKNPK